MKCSRIPEFPYSRFSQDIHAKSIKQRIPVNGTLELTYRCNLACRHCYCPPLINKELTYQQICRLLDELASSGCLWLLITGGEPLLRRDFADIYVYAKKKGFIVNIFTNATLIDKKIINTFKKYPPFNIEVTLYGADTKTYESVTLSKGSFKRCLRGIRLLRRAKINLSLKATVNILNFGQVFAMKKYSAKLGLDFRFDATIHPRLDKDKANCLWRIGADTAAGFDVKDLDRKRSWKEYLVKFNNKRSGRRIFRCLGGQNSFNIDPYGELNICDMFYGQGYDLFSGSFMQGWNDFIPKFLKGEYSKKTACLACPAVDFCDQCPGWSWLENNDIKKARVEYLCQIAYNRVRLLGWGK